MPSFYNLNHPLAERLYNTKVKYFRPKPQAISFTEAGFTKLEADHKRLSQKREEVIGRLQIAREMGDLSENAAYKSARFELGGIDRELRRLNHLLEVGKVVKTKATDGTIGFGNTVTLDANKKKLTFTLVSGYESNPSEQKLSLTSPLGQAIIGKKAGDTVIVAAPGGKTTYTVLSVK